MIKITQPKVKIPTVSKAALDTNLLVLTGSIRSFMQTRTKSGQDLNHGLFKPYSDSYALQKQKRGKTGTVVQLVDTGNMFRSMSIRQISRGYQIYFADKNRAAIAYYHQSGSGQPKREWFGLNQADANVLFKRFGYKIPVVVFK